MDKERLKAAARVMSEAADEATTIVKYTSDLAELLAAADGAEQAGSTRSQPNTMQQAAVFTEAAACCIFYAKLQ